MTVFVWTAMGIALWHFTIFVPDRFAGGIIGAFLAAWFGAVASGFVLEGFAIPEHNPPGLRHVLYALPGALIGLGACWALGRDPHAEAAAQAHRSEVGRGRHADSAPSVQSARSGTTPAA